MALTFLYLMSQPPWHPARAPAQPASKRRRDRGAATPGQHATPPRHRPQFRPADRAVLATLSRALPRQQWSVFLVTPDTILQWHRRLVTRKWTQSRRQGGRPALADHVVALILRLARENPRWGYQRIKGELVKLGVTVSATRSEPCYHAMGLDPHHDERPPPGKRSSAHRPQPLWPPTSSPWKPST
jgi:hypothetical protein